MATASILLLISSGCPQLRGLCWTTVTSPPPPPPQKHRPLSYCNWFVLNHCFCNLFTGATKSGQRLTENGGRAELIRALLALKGMSRPWKHPILHREQFLNQAEEGWLLPCRLVAPVFAQLILPLAVLDKDKHMKTSLLVLECLWFTLWLLFSREIFSLDQMKAEICG